MLDALRLQVRMSVTLLLLSTFYGVVAGILRVLIGLPIWLVVVGVGAFLLAQYFFGYRMILEQVNAREIPASEAPNLTRFVKRASDSLDVAPPRIMVGDFSGPNAFAIGRQGAGTIIVSEELVSVLNPDELAAVIAHELTHIHNRDAVVMVLGGSLAFFLSYLQFVLDERVSQSHPLTTVGTAITTPLVHLFTILFVLPVTRYREYVADREAAIATDPEVLASALERVAAAHEYTSPEAPLPLRSLFLYNTTSEVANGVFATHPPIRERINRLYSDSSGDSPA